MGMNITPLTRPEVPLTTSNLIVDSNLSMGQHDIITNNLGVGGDVAINGSVVRVVECIPSDTIYSIHYTGTYNGGKDHINVEVLPFIPSTYYRGSINVSMTINSGSLIDYVTRVYVFMSDNTASVTTITSLNVITNIELPDNTIGVYINAQSSSASGHSGILEIRVGYTNNYLPLPTPQEIL